MGLLPDELVKHEGYEVAHQIRFNRADRDCSETAVQEMLEEKRTRVILSR